jgi:hypothetical protein
VKTRPSPSDQEVDRINRIRESEFWRDPDRPSGKFVPARQRQNPEVRKAKARARTAAWRTRLDRLRRPEARDIGMSLVAALVTSPHLDHAMTDGELRFVTAALADLHERGFDLEQVKVVMRRIRRRLVDSDTTESKNPIF